SALLFGDIGLESFAKERLADERILALAARVQAEEDPDSDYPAHCPAILEVTARGKIYRRHVPYHPGSPEAPLSKNDVLDKFERNTRWYFAEGARSVGERLAGTPHEASYEAVVSTIETAASGIARAAE